MRSIFRLSRGWRGRFASPGSTGATGELTTANQAPRNVFGFTTVPQENAGGNKTYTEFYADDGMGIRHVAIDESEGLQSRLSDHFYVIKLPVSAGTSWREIDRTFDGTVYDATTRIESVNDNVSVPAGTFSGCVRIRSTGFASAMKGSARAPGRDSGLRLVAGEDVSIEDYYWLAPGVGPVKATHQESRGEARPPSRSASPWSWSISSNSCVAASCLRARGTSLPSPSHQQAQAPRIAFVGSHRAQPPAADHA